MSDQVSAARVWRSLARNAVRKVNFGWWLDWFSPLLIAASLIFAGVVLFLRTKALPIAENLPLAISAGVCLIAIAGIAWFLASRRFLSQEQALVRLEDRMHLQNALTTADRGIGKWPTPPLESNRSNDGLEWNWSRVFGPLAIALISMVASILIPVSHVSAAKPPPSEPLAWAQMEEWMEELEEENLIEEEAIEEVEEKIDELRRQPEEEWFSHSSLEATDTLKQTLQQQIQNLGAEMATAERDLNALQNYGDQLSEETRDQLMAEYDQALQDMALSGLPLNPDLLEQLENIDFSQLSQAQISEVMKSALSQMTEQEQQELAHALKDGNLAEAMQNGTLGEMGLSKEMLEALQQMSPGELHQLQAAQLTQEEINALREALQKGAAACQKPGGNGTQPGQGLPELMTGDAAMMALLRQQRGMPGIQRGPGPAPLFLGDQETDLKTGNIEGVSNTDMSRAAPGAVLGVGLAEYDLDETSTGPQQAGSVQSVGQGGDTVWKESLMPSEKKVLKRYFK